MLLSNESLNHEYLPITGLAEFLSAAAKLILGPLSAAIRDDRVVSVQTISGTGANHLAALFLSRHYTWDGPSKIWLSNPTWGECYVDRSAKAHAGCVKRTITQFLRMSASSPLSILTMIPRLKD
jgi:aspartate/tyrosine/aromatic aminotransferase